MKPNSPPRDAEPGSSEYKRANVENSILPELTCSVKSRKRALMASVSSNGIFGSKVTICTSTVVGMFGRLSWDNWLKYLRTSEGVSLISPINWCCICCTTCCSRTISLRSSLIWENFLPKYSSNFSRDPIWFTAMFIHWSTLWITWFSFTVILSILAWFRYSFCIAICSGITQYGSPSKRTPSFWLYKRCVSISERKIASSPTTHTISSITLSCAITMQEQQARKNTLKIFFIMSTHL